MTERLDRQGVCENKTGTSKVGAISKAQKCKVFKIVKGDPLGFLNIQFVAKYQKIEGDFGNIKIEKRLAKPKSHKGGGESLIVPKNRKGGPIVLYFMLEAFDAFKIKN